MLWLKYFKSFLSLAVAAFGFTYERNQVVSYTYYLYESTTHLHIMNPATSFNFEVYTGMFKLNVWISIVLFSLSLAPLMYLVTQYVNLILWLIKKNIISL